MGLEIISLNEVVEKMKLSLGVKFICFYKYVGKWEAKRKMRQKEILLLPLVNKVIKKLQCWAVGRLSNMQIYFLHTSLTQLVFVFGCLLCHPKDILNQFSYTGKDLLHR